MQKMIQADIWTIVQTKEGSAILLRPRGKNIAVPIFIGELEIQAILIGKENIQLPRPLTHDLLINFMNNLGFSLDRVEIHDLIENTFHARLVITGWNYTEEDPFILDCRPSDAIALAARRKCPIMISSGVIRQTGISLDIFSGVLDIDNITPNEEKRRALMKQLDDAVENEEYEKAAEIRDMLKKMEA